MVRPRMTAQAVWARMRVILGAVLALSAVGCGGTRSSVARLAGDGAEYAGPVTVAAATLQEMTGGRAIYGGRQGRQRHPCR